MFPSMDLRLRPAHTFSTTDLNNDIWLLVLDRITTIRDLKSLCLTSKAFRSRATPRLYNKILIRLWNEAEVKYFIHSVANGAGLLLANTRTLVIECDTPPPEPSSVAIGSWGFGACQWDAALHSDRDRTLEIILQMFPKNKLTSFQFISSFPIRLELMLHLKQDQTQISHIQLSAKNERSFSWEIFRNFRNLRSLSLFTVDEDALMLAVQGLCGIESLECLTLGQAVPDSNKRSYSRAMRGGVDKAVSETASRGFSMPASNKFLPRLTDLSLQGFDLTDLASTILGMLDVSKLSRLTLFNCVDAIQFFSDLSKANKRQPLSLSHLCVQGREACTERGLTSFEKQLWRTLLQTEALESLHLSWVNRSPFGNFMESSLCTAHGVLSLSAHVYLSWNTTNGGEYEYDEDGEYFEDECATFTLDRLRELCVACPNIRAIGLQFAEAFISPDQWAYSREVEDSIGCLQYLPELRFLHLRQPIYVDIATSAASTKACTFDLQRFANAFFDILHIHGYCSKLEALVVGCLTDRSTNRGRLGDCYRTQHCFVRGFQTDVLGRKVAVAVPVTRSVLRRVGEYTDILDFDPQCDRVGGLDGSGTG